MEEREVSKLLKIALLIDIITGIFFGFLMLLIPEIYSDMIGWPYLDPVVSRLFGAALFGFTTMSCFAYREKTWDRVKNIVIMDIVYLLLGTIVVVLSQFIFELPIANWTNIVVYVMLLALFIICYFQHQK